MDEETARAMVAGHFAALGVDDDRAASEWTLHFEREEPDAAVKIHEFRDGRVVRERIYIAEPWEPPAYRARWTEPITD